MSSPCADCCTTAPHCGRRLAGQKRLLFPPRPRVQPWLHRPGTAWAPTTVAAEAPSGSITADQPRSSSWRPRPVWAKSLLPPPTQRTMKRRAAPGPAAAGDGEAWVGAGIRSWGCWARKDEEVPEGRSTTRRPAGDFPKVTRHLGLQPARSAGRARPWPRYSVRPIWVPPDIGSQTAGEAQGLGWQHALGCSSYQFLD